MKHAAVCLSIAAAGAPLTAPGRRDEAPVDIRRIYPQAEELAPTR